MGPIAMDGYTISIDVNATKISATVERRRLLVHFLREQAGKTGTHIGCDTSQCGACTVRKDGMTVKSCTVLAVQANGHAITTAGGFDRDGALAIVKTGDAGLLAFGRYFTSNPDLPYRLKYNLLLGALTF